MAFRLKLAKSAGKDVRRLLNGQVDRALRVLNGAGSESEAAIHEARKSLKRCRSLLRLARRGLPAKSFAAEDARFRAIAKALSHTRDRHVLQQTILRLQAGSAVPGARDALADAAPLFDPPALNGATYSDSEADIARAVSLLREAEAAIDDLKLKKLTIDAIADGLARTYGEARDALKVARRKRTDEHFHELRKMVQHHLRHVQLVSAAWPEAYAPRIDAARRLAQLLGDDHDLSMLIAALAETEGATAPARSDTVIGLARAEQARLRTEIEPLAGLLFARTPADIARELVRLWPAACQLAALTSDEKAAIKRGMDAKMPVLSGA